MDPLNLWILPVQWFRLLIEEFYGGVNGFSFMSSAKAIVWGIEEIKDLDVILQEFFNKEEEVGFEISPLRLRMTSRSSWSSEEAADGMLELFIRTLNERGLRSKFLSEKISYKLLWKLFLKTYDCDDTS